MHVFNQKVSNNNYVPIFVFTFLLIRLKASNLACTNKAKRKHMHRLEWQRKHIAMF
jgi:hypothetical protein